MTHFNDRWQNAYGGASEPTYMGRGNDRAWENVREGPFRGRGPKDYRRSDERIREDACEALTEDDHIDASSIEVFVMNGAVTLSGAVTSREQKRRAVDVVERVRGVAAVENHLRVIGREEGDAQRTGEQPAVDPQMTGTEQTKLGAFR